MTGVCPVIHANQAFNLFSRVNYFSLQKRDNQSDEAFSMKDFVYIFGADFFKTVHLNVVTI